MYAYRILPNMVARMLINLNQSFNRLCIQLAYFTQQMFADKMMSLSAIFAENFL